MSGIDDINIGEFIRDFLDLERMRSPLFQVLKKEESTDLNGSKYFNFTISRSRFQGKITFPARDMAEAEATFNLNQGDLAQGFDQLSMNPASAPNMSGRDWRFEYDSGSANPIYKYEVVHGTIPKPNGRFVSFSMVKYY